MRYLQVVILLFLFSFTTQAQRTAHFETKVFFEDAIGNTDTITIGFDPLANADYNPEFGEEDIATPFDDIFEVRAAHGLGMNRRGFILSKKIIGRTERVFGLPYPCIGPEEMVFFIHAINQPVKIKWDRTVFDGDSCIGGAYVTHFSTHLTVPWWQLPEREGRFVCAAQIDSVELLLGRKNNPGRYGEFYYDLMHEIEGRGVDSIYGVALGMDVPRVQTFACDITTSTTTPTAPPPTSLSVYPNPTADLLHLKEGKLKWPKIYNQQGQIVWQIVQWNKGQSIDLSHLPSGVYFLQALQENKLVRQKILKL